MTKQIAGMTMSEDVAALNPEMQALASVTKPSKYHNAKASAHGMTFQSGHEAAGVSGLILAEGRTVFGLRLQVKFPLPGEPENSYIADAVYLELVDGKLVPRVTDFKGYETQAYRIKKRLFKATYGMEITEL